MNMKELPEALKKLVTAPTNRKARILLWVQATLFLFLVATFFLVLAVDESARERLYCWLIAGLALLILAAIVCNLRGKEDASALLTVIATVVGPWGAILLDHTIFHGDFVPLIYISLSIQLCAILLSVKPTVVIAVFQVLMLSLCIILHQELQAINWPSLLAFVVLTSGISIVASTLYKKQYNEINAQKEQLQQSECRLREISVRDPLTGLYNRRHMDTVLEQEINRSSRNHYPLGIIMVDIDQFKAINDDYGHVYGDYVLHQVSRVFCDHLRNFDIVCRYGGDEFILVMPQIPLEDTLRRAEELRQIIESMVFTLEGKAFKASLSCGIAAYPEHGQTSEALLKAADRALYTAKQNGRNHVVAAVSQP